MQRLIYTVDIDEEFYELNSLLGVLDESISYTLGCNVIKSRIEYPDEICENGDWEE